MDDDLVKRICQQWVDDGRADECFWEGWPECPTPEDSLTPGMVLDRIEELEAKLKVITEHSNVVEAANKELEAKLAMAERALSLTWRADHLRELYHQLPNDKNRIGDKRSRKSHARDAWLRAFRKAARESRTAIAELTGGNDGC